MDAPRPARDIRVLIADDEALVRAGFKVLVDSAPGLSVVGEASDGVQAVRQARALKPDVVLMDIRMPVMGGLEATKVILDGGQDPPPRILVVTTFDQDEHVFEALRGGASGFVLKDTPPEKLLDAITIVAAGEALLAPAITRRLIAEFARQPRAATRSAEDALAQLTERERDVLQQVAAGRVQHRDRRRPVPVRGHGQDPYQPTARQAGLSRPRAARRGRVRDRRRHPRPAVTGRQSRVSCRGGGRRS